MWVILFAGLILAWGATMLAGCWRQSETPSLRRARAFAGTGGLLLGTSLVTAHHALWALSALLAIAGVAFLTAWLAIVYAHSLHNTTM